MRRSLLAIGVLALGLLAVGMPIAAAERAVKKAAAAPADVEARENVQQALLAETLGDNAERGRRLAAALLNAPELPAANWHTARVQIDGKWLPLAQVTNEAASDSNLALYRELREKAQTPKLLRDLARWCKKRGWQDIAELHYAQLLSQTGLDTETQQEAIKELDLQPIGGMWLTSEEIKARQEQIRAVEAALVKWRPRLKKLQVIIDGESYIARDRSIKDLATVDDPQVILPLESFLLDGGDRFCEEAPKVLAKFPQIEATEALVRYAVMSPYLAARDAAIAGLKSRPKHDYVPLLLSGLASPIKAQFSITVNARGTIQYTHALMQENANARLIKVGNEVSQPVLSQQIGPFTPASRNRIRLDLVLAEAARLEQIARERNIELEANIVNQQAEQTNRPIFDALGRLVDAQVSRDANAWQKWWQDYNEYYWPKPTYCAYEHHSCCYVAGTGMSCFIAGTLVRTQTGLAPIESVRAGDRVLAQDQDTGELAYKAVLRTTLRPPSKMVTIKAGDEEIVTTLGHPFSVSGQGWKMAKQLQAGDLLHSLGGAVKVENVEPLAREPRAYNLVVDDFNTYFIGQAGLLVHDNEFRKPTRAIVPGLVTDDGPQPKK